MILMPILRSFEVNKVVKDGSEKGIIAIPVKVIGLHYILHVCGFLLIVICFVFSKNEIYYTLQKLIVNIKHFFNRRIVFTTEVASSC